MAKNNAGRGKKRLFAPMSFIIIIAAMLLGMSVFFTVSAIEVTGTAVYDKKQIIDASGLQQGDNLFFINRFKVVGNIRARLPYIEKVTISRKLPGLVVIGVTESVAVAVIAVEGEMWAIDCNCKTLGRTDDSSLIIVVGFDPEEPIVGLPLAAKDGDDVKLKYLSAILTALADHDMLDETGSVDISSVLEPYLIYAGRFKVKTGRNENLDYKLELLRSCVEKLSATEAGTIDLTIDNRAHFIPD